MKRPIKRSQFGENVRTLFTVKQYYIIGMICDYLSKTSLKTTLKTNTQTLPTTKREKKRMVHKQTTIMVVYDIGIPYSTFHKGGCDKRPCQRHFNHNKERVYKHIQTLNNKP